MARDNSGPGKQILLKLTAPIHDLNPLTVLGRSQLANGSALCLSGLISPPSQ